MQLDDKQLEAVEITCNTEHFITSVTGKAGTGKTTIMKQAHDRLTKAGMLVVFCAPTGRAAKRMTDATGIPAKTIHRLLEYGYPQIDEATGNALYTPKPRRNADNPLPEMALFIDEASMLTQELAENILAALPEGSCIRFFGDVNQLPPVEPKRKSLVSPFQKVLSSKPSVTLDRVYRQDKDSGIYKNSLNVLNKGKLVRADDFAIDTLDNLDKYLEQYDFTSMRNQIITTTNIKDYGTKKLNPYLQKKLNNSLDSIELERVPWMKGKRLRLKNRDKILITQNTCHPEYEAYNGESGVLTDTNSCTLDLGDRTVDCPSSIKVSVGKRVITLKPRQNIDLGYAVTTHKSQGGEYDVVLYLLDERSWVDPHNIYTAITRAREKCILLTNIKDMLDV